MRFSFLSIQTELLNLFDGYFSFKENKQQDVLNPEMPMKKCFPLWYKDLSKQSWCFWCNSSPPSPSQFSCQHLEQRVFPLLMVYKTRERTRYHYWGFLWAVWSLETEWIKAPTEWTRWGHVPSFAAWFLSIVEQTPFLCMSLFLMEQASFRGCFEVQLLRREFENNFI